MTATIICFRKAHWNKSQRERAVHENPVFLFIALRSVGSGSSGHIYSTKHWTPRGRFTHICANWPYLKPIFVWGQAYQSHSLNATFNPDFKLQQPIYTKSECFYTLNSFMTHFQWEQENCVNDVFSMNSVHCKILHPKVKSKIASKIEIQIFSENVKNSEWIVFHALSPNKPQI